MEEIKKSWHSLPKGFRIAVMAILGVCGAVLLGFLFGLFVKLLWNWLMPDLFNLKEITYWQAVGIVVLAHLIFGSFGTGKGSDSSDKKKSKCEEKQDSKGETKHWQYYDEWWKQQGKQSFENYAQGKESKNDSSSDE
jgi:hypothetical protein